jgi:hypothetical protein
MGTVPESILLQTMKALVPRVASARLFPLLAFYGPREFRFPEFCADVEGAEDVPARRGGRPPDQLTSLLTRIKAHIVIGSLSTTEMFRSADPARVGFCRRDKTGAAFEAVGIELSDGEIELLHNAFELGGRPERFDYRRLCRALETLTIDRATAAKIVSAAAE